MNDFVELSHLFRLFLKRWPIILLGMVLGAGLAFGISRELSPVYRATATLLVGQPIQAANVDSRDIQTSEQLALTYAEIGRRQPVLQATVEALDLHMTWRQLQEEVRFKPVEGTQLLDVIAEAGSREEARRIADELARQLILLSPASQEDESSVRTSQFVEQRLASLQERIESGQARLSVLEAELADANAAAEMTSLQEEIDVLEGLITDWEASYAQLLALVDDEQSTNALAFVDRAHVDPDPVWPRVRLNTLIGGILGLLSATGIIIWRDYWDESLQSIDDLGRFLGLTPLGIVNKIKGRDYRDKLITTLAPFSPASEAYRIIRSNIRFISEESPSDTILVTSGTFGEGKSLTVANLALAMAQAGHRTIIVDADLRRPVQHEIFGLPNEQGLTDLLRSQVLDFDDHVVETDVESLHLLPAGDSPPNPAELLSSGYTELLLAGLVEQADIVILDGPPVLAVSDSTVLSSLVDGVVLVVESGRTERRAAGRTISMLQQAGANLLGVVLNRASRAPGADYYKPYRPTVEDGDDQPAQNRWWQSPFRGMGSARGTAEVTSNGEVTGNGKERSSETP